MSQVVKYHNDLNTVPMRSWSAEEMNFFFSILSKLRDKGTDTIEFDTDDLKDLSRFADKHQQRWVDTMENVASKISQLTYIERSDEKTSVMTLFSQFDIYPQIRKIEVSVSKNFDYIVNRISANFTTYELEEFTQIKSTYAKTVYRLLKQWRTVGKKEYGIEEFKRLLGMPDYYTPSHIDKNILKYVMKELPAFFVDLKIKKIKKNTRGTPVTGYIFTWKPESTIPWIDNKYAEPISTNVSTSRHSPSFTNYLVKYNFVTSSDKKRIEQFKIDVFPLYQKMADKHSLEYVEAHFAYMSKKLEENAEDPQTKPIGYFKTSANNYLKRGL